MKKPEALAKLTEFRFDLSRAAVQTAVLGTAALASLGVNKVLFNEDSGDLRVHKATINKPALIDNNFKMGSWNMARRAAGYVDEIKAIVTNEDLDTFALQEVEPAGIKALETELPEFNITSDPVKSRPEVLHQNLADVMITRQPLKDVKAHEIEGTSSPQDIGGATVAMATSAPNFKQGYSEAAKEIQENRTILAGTVKVQDGDEQRDIRVATTHISANRIIHKVQMEEVMKFVARDIKPERPSVICGDFNANLNETTSEFSLNKLIVPPNLSPTTRGGRTIDHCAYFVSNIRRLGRIKTLKNYLTDHRPIIFNWQLPDLSQPDDPKKPE